MTHADQRAHESADESREYVCVICGRTVCYEPPLPAIYPFCSPRCKWVDLGRWLAEEYSIDAEPGEDQPGDCIDRQVDDAPRDDHETSP